MVDEPCEVCELKNFPDEDGVVPVWENPEDYNRGAPPDYLGCTKCHTMRPYEPEATDA